MSDVGSAVSEDLSLPEERLLRLLADYSPSLEKAWDVTREISLPGMSEALGVVRSALNVPLTSLEQRGFLFKRMAHVIGGGSRRRNVYHLTDEGRSAAAQLGANDAKPRKSSSKANILGDPPTEAPLYGRLELVKQIASKMEVHQHLLISGLPGIGKTSVGLGVGGHFLSKSTEVRWATANEFSDMETLCLAMNFTEPLPLDTHALAQHIAVQSQNSVLIIDDVDLISTRHLESFVKFCRLMKDFNGPKMILIGREPLALFEDIERVTIPSLPLKDAVKLLNSSSKDKASMHIVERLGGHPLAILLYQQESSLPEQDADVQSYVEEVVLSTLEQSIRAHIDHLVLLPQPIEASKAYSSDAIGTLDDYGFLRWTTKTEKMEVQHLVRNVRRLSLSESEKIDLHRQAVEHWESIAETGDDFAVLLHHQIHARMENLESFCTSAFQQLASTHSNALSILLEQAIEVNSSSRLHYLAAKLALERCEPAHVHTHLSSIEDEGDINHIAMGLAYLEGRIEDAERCIETGLSLADSHQKNQLALSAASRRLDDRISNEIPAGAVKDVKKYLSNIELPAQSTERSVTVVALTMVQHALALAELDFQRAESLRTNLSSISTFDSALVRGLGAKATLLQSLSSPSTNWTEVKKQILDIADSQPSRVHRDSLLLSLTETLLETAPELAKDVFSQVTKPNSSPNSILLHRLHARWWHCKSYLQSSLQKVALKEAITQFRAAGCPRAAKILEAKIHSLL